ncbi:hypothetical protein [Streptomyces herbicida]|uniref:hypothetical protein n=1 Tax=Streptomyces herbicida TaxID=3065675 RepID=UPI0029312EFD|nr:hypothetical protein [Streptomyces sp. NEAU-HV9]
MVISRFGDTRKPVPSGSSRPFSRSEIRATVRAARAAGQEAPRLQLLGHPEDALVRGGCGQRLRAYGLHHQGGRHGMPVQQARGARGDCLR